MAAKLTAFLHSPHYNATPSASSFATIQTFVLSPSIQWLPVFFRTLAFIVAAPIMFFTALDIAAYLIARTLGAPHHHQRESHLVKVPAYAARDHLDNPAIIISPAVTSNIEPSSLSSALSNLQNQLPKASCSSDRHRLPTPPSELASCSSSSSTRSTLNLDSPKLPLHFTTASEGNFALSGEGIFSPPESRAGSPPPSEPGSRIRDGYKTRARAASIGVEALGAITDSTDNEEDDTDSVSSGAGTSAGPNGKAFLAATPTAKGAALRKRKPGLQFTPVR